MPSPPKSDLVALRRRIVSRTLEVTGLIGPLYRRTEGRLARQPTDPFDDGRPMPPPELMVAVAGTPDGRWFSEQGRRHAEMFAGLAARHGRDPRAGASVLDFGCGCGRIARWLAPEVIAGGGAFHGSDLNPRLVAWCGKNLPGRYTRNRLAPPLPLADGAFDVVYAHSVLTHLREPMTVRWLAEVARVLRPRGVALMTFHDRDYAEGLAPPEVRARLEAEPYVVLNDALQGSNYLSAWTTREHFAGLARPAFEVAEIIPGDPAASTQAIAVLRKPGAPSA
jgi:SAM-dependent methyltransferase